MKKRHWTGRGRHSTMSSAKRLIEWSDDVTNILKKIVIMLLLAIMLSQLALQIPVVRNWVTGVDRLEGVPF
ncbi:hypothetical protein PAECIP111893_04709 [Paenibacillus plantiphilus]|uniref:Uncharacterized protein n=1 Tax=Paenibacillus plantiphilus TaxID=2905650 RepID=A0ABM9CSE5_9BACL|nr:hypothetical protein [Paenibacillus plantiphilus]CAH1221363.1 hypothetical protein PAECIP111893_04709 [Paenibacillus plantiphilus]